jgi:hypothetical protein
MTWGGERACGPVFDRQGENLGAPLMNHLNDVYPRRI